MLRQLPNKPRFRTCWSTSRRRVSAPGLEEKLFQPLGENRKDFYAELPISIRLTGNYHEMGTFRERHRRAARIVTLHDVEIVPAAARPRAAGVPGDLTLNVTAKTYRYSTKTNRTTGGPASRAGRRR